jgi:hypothetical protein
MCKMGTECQEKLLGRLKKRWENNIIIVFLDYNCACCLYGCETWSVTLREEHRLRVFENRVLRGIFGPKRQELTGTFTKTV